MAISVRLDPKATVLLGRLAKRKGTTKSEVIREALDTLAEREEKTQGATAYEMVSHLLGCADSGGRRLSEKTGRKFRALLEERTRAGRSR